MKATPSLQHYLLTDFEGWLTTNGGMNIFTPPADPECQPIESFWKSPTKDCVRSCYALGRTQDQLLEHVRIAWYGGEVGTGSRKLGSWRTCSCDGADEGQIRRQIVHSHKFILEESRKYLKDIPISTVFNEDYVHLHTPCDRADVWDWRAPHYTDDVDIRRTPLSIELVDDADLEPVLLGDLEIEDSAMSAETVAEMSEIAADTDVDARNTDVDI